MKKIIVDVIKYVLIGFLLFQAPFHLRTSLVLVFAIYLVYRNPNYLVTLFPSLFLFYKDIYALIIYSSLIVLMYLFGYLFKRSKALLIILSIIYSFLFNYVIMLGDLSIVLTEVYLIVSLFVVIFTILTSFLITYYKEGKLRYCYIKNTFIFDLIFLTLSSLVALYLNNFLTYLYVVLVILYLNYKEDKSKAITYASALLLIYLLHFNNYLGLSFLIIALLSSWKGKLLFLLPILFFFINFFYIKYEVKNLNIAAFFLTIYYLLKLFSPKKTKVFQSSQEIMMESFNNEVLAFSSFLDFLKKNYENTKQFNSYTNECFMIFINSFCLNCQKKFFCFSDKKVLVYEYFKEILKYGSEVIYKKEKMNSKKIIDICLYKNDLLMRANELRVKYQISDDKGKNNFLIEIDGASKTLRNYAINASLKNNKAQEKLADFYFVLLKNNFNVAQYDIRGNLGSEFLFIEFKNYNLKYNPLIKDLSTRFFAEEMELEIVSFQDKTVSLYLRKKSLLKYTIEALSLAYDKYNIGGDNYLIKEKNNSLYVALSDGMGSGYMAYLESKETLRLLGEISNLYLSKETIVNMLNTFYQMKDQQESFATLDLLIINKFQSMASLFKMGATNSYIVSKGEIKTIYNDNLPLGITDLITYKEFEIENNDLIVLFTDGVTEHIEENRLEEYILSISHKPVNRIVYDLLNYIYEINNKKIDDDMSVIALRIEI